MVSATDNRTGPHEVPTKLVGTADNRTPRFPPAFSRVLQHT